MSLRARLAAKQLPTASITLAPLEEGADPDVVTVRALPALEWDALVQAHPPTDEQREQGYGWDPDGFLPALLVECVVTPDGEEPLTADEWVELMGSVLPFGHREAIIDAALALNDNRWPAAELGKGSK